MEDNKDNEEPEAYELIRDLARGSLNAELGDRIRQVGTLLRLETMRTEKRAKGEVVLKLKFSAELNGEDEVLVGCSYEVERKEPAPVRRTDVYYVSNTGMLVREATGRDGDGPLFAPHEDSVGNH